jgi:hypothetical protein
MKWMGLLGQAGWAVLDTARSKPTQGLQNNQR